MISVLLGMVFFLSGTLKLMDSVGTQLIMESYFNFFGTSGLLPIAKAAGFCVAFFETVLGAAIITGVWRKIVGWASGITIFLFTILTFILWIKNPDMDCGCFGEAIHLTHAQSLIKNVILLAMWAFAFIPMKMLSKPKGIKYATFSLAVISTLVFSIGALNGIPLMNFTPFKPGTQIGVETNFDQVPLSYCDHEGEYHDEDLQEGSTLIVSIYKPDEEKLQRAFTESDLAQKQGYKTAIMLTEPMDIPEDTLCYYADRKTLMSLNRSNGGVTYVNNGEIVRQWSSRRMPDEEELQELKETDSLEAMLHSSASGRLRFQAYLLYVFALMLLL